MTPAQREDAELLHSLGRPAEVIAINTGLPLEIVRDWLRTGRWPGPRQGRLFDPNGLSPRPEATKPTDTTEGISGLRLFSADGVQGRTHTPSHSGQERHQ